MSSITAPRLSGRDSRLSLPPPPLAASSPRLRMPSSTEELLPVMSHRLPFHASRGNGGDTFLERGVATLYQALLEQLVHQPHRPLGCDLAMHHFRGGEACRARLHCRERCRLV